MNPDGVISADSHINEPPNLFVERVDRDLRDRAPRVITTEEGDIWVFDSGKPRPLGLDSAAGKRPEEFRRTGVTYREMRAGAYDPAARLPDMDQDGIAAEVLYPGTGFRLLKMADPALALACCRAYNDWMSEFAAYAPDRLIGLGLLPGQDVPAAIEELQRCARLGLRGAILPALLDGVQYNDPCYEPLWATAASLKMPLSFHIGGVRGLALDGGPPGTTDAYVLLGGLALAEPLSLVLFSGAFARYPDLKIVLVEGGIGWLAFLVERMDSMYERHRFWTQSVLTERPSTYFREHVRATFLRDSVGLRERETIGIGVPMWSSDYPHSDSTWPHSQEAIAQQFADIPEADRRRIVHDNAAELYGLR